MCLVCAHIDRICCMFIISKRTCCRSVRDFCLLKVGMTVLCVSRVGDIADGVNGGGVNKARSTAVGEHGVGVRGVTSAAVGVTGVRAATVGVTGVLGTTVCVAGDGAAAIGIIGACVIGFWSNGIGHGS